MKTLKKGDEIVRKSDEDAYQLVKSGWAYCKKSEWKKFRGPVKQVVSTKNPDQPWKDKKAARREEKAEVKREETAADIMAGGDKNLAVAMNITAQEDRKGKKDKKAKKS